MGKNHFQKFHANEKKIKRCLRCIINDKSEFIESQAAQITDLKYEKDKLKDEVEYLKDELRIAKDRKDFYKYKYYKLRD